MKHGEVYGHVVYTNQDVTWEAWFAKYPRSPSDMFQLQVVGMSCDVMVACDSVCSEFRILHRPSSMPAERYCNMTVHETTAVEKKQR